MKAIVLSDGGVRFNSDYASRPQPDWVPIRVLKAGICETDLQLIQGYMGFSGVLGHEFVGIAEQGRYAGQRVTGEINAACHNCPTCQAGMPTHCPKRTVLGILNHDGAFAETVWLPEENLHPIPEHVSDDAAVFVEPLAAAFQIPAQLDLSEFKNIVILGDGRLGNLCAQVCQLRHSKVLVVGKHSEKLARLQQRGIETALLDEIDDQRFADLVVDCTGSATGFPTACQFVRPRGTIVLKTTVAGEQGPNLAPIVIDEICVIGSRCGPFVPAIEALAKDELDVTSLITSRFTLEECETAFQTATAKDQLKVLFEIG
ncbi:MAG: alcohol dehydrogenase catalytic domain-containing protein [Planctomycetaceae bacterium]|nr:alcohol dehydrogenase catalytic domain-containing protein [Planctomycetaceae bacterium]